MHAEGPRFLKCKAAVDNTPKGWFITCIDRDPEAIRRAEERAKRGRADMDDEERHMKQLEKQGKMASAPSMEALPPGPADLERTNPEGKVAFSLQVS